MSLVNEFITLIYIITLNPAYKECYNPQQFTNKTSPASLRTNPAAQSKTRKRAPLRTWKKPESPFIPAWPMAILNGIHILLMDSWPHGHSQIYYQSNIWPRHIRTFSHLKKYKYIMFIYIYTFIYIIYNKLIPSTVTKHMLQMTPPLAL